jgi:hypothetical protein
MSKKQSNNKKPSTPLKSLNEIPSPKPPASNGAKVPALPPSPRLRQTEIPGTERPKFKALEEQAELYCDLRDKMQNSVKKFKEQGKTPLIDMLHKYKDKLDTNGEGETVYAYDDMIVILKPAGEQLRVKHVDPEAEEIEVGAAPADNSEGEV